MYLTTKEAASRLGTNVRRIQDLLAQGRIVGAQRVGRSWIIDETFSVLPTRIFGRNVKNKDRHAR